MYKRGARILRHKNALSPRGALDTGACREVAKAGSDTNEASESGLVRTRQSRRRRPREVGTETGSRAAQE